MTDQDTVATVSDDVMAAMQDIEESAASQQSFADADTLETSDNEEMQTVVENSEDDDVIDDTNVEVEEDQEQETSEDIEEDLSPPENWSKEDKEAFSGLDRKGQEVLLSQSKNLERGYNRKFQDLAEASKRDNEIANLMQPFEVQLQAAGMDRMDGIRALVGTHRLLTEKPEDALRQIISQFGNKEIISKIAGELGVGGAADYSEAQPDYRTESEIETENRIKNLESQLSQSQQLTQQQYTSQVQAEIDRFANATDEGGNLQHPHFSQVQNKMASLINSGESSTLEDAYNQAVWANPETRKLEQEREFAKQESARKAQVEKAKRAAKNPPSKRAAPTGKPSELSLDDEVREIYYSVAGQS